MALRPAGGTEGGEGGVDAGDGKYATVSARSMPSHVDPQSDGLVQGAAMVVCAAGGPRVGWPMSTTPAGERLSSSAFVSIPMCSSWSGSRRWLSSTRKTTCRPRWASALARALVRA